MKNNMQSKMLVMIFCFIVWSVAQTQIVIGQVEKDDAIIDRTLDIYERDVLKGESAAQETLSVVGQQPSLVDLIWDNDYLQNQENVRIDSLEVRNLEIQEVLKIISEKSGLEFNVGDNVQGNITIYLRDVDVWDALRIILDTNDLAYYREEGRVDIMTAAKFQATYGYPFGQEIQLKVISFLHAKAVDFVDILDQVKSPLGKIILNEQENTLILMDSPKDLASMVALIKEWDVPIETEIFEFDNIDARDVAKRVENLLTKNIGRIQIDERTNNIVVTDTQLKIKEIANLIEKLDRRKMDILVDVHIIQILLNEEHRQGVDWEAIVSKYQPLPFPGFEQAVDFRESKNLSLGTISKEDYDVLIEALDTVGEIKIISDFQLTATEREESEFLVNLSDQMIPWEELKAQKDIDKKGEVKFQLSSVVREEDTIDVNIQVQEITDAGQNQLPFEPQQDLTNRTRVSVTDEAKIVIGSLFHNVMVVSTRKIPLLGDLPLLGFIFRNQGQKEQKTEIIIFLTPKIVKESESI